LTLGLSNRGIEGLMGVFLGRSLLVKWIVTGRRAFDSVWPMPLRSRVLRSPPRCYLGTWADLSRCATCFDRCVIELNFLHDRSFCSATFGTKRDAAGGNCRSEGRAEAGALGRKAGFLMIRVVGLSPEIYPSRINKYSGS
jgi:hypothetical protein